MSTLSIAPRYAERHGLSTAPTEPVDRSTYDDSPEALQTLYDEDYDPQPARKPKRRPKRLLRVLTRSVAVFALLIALLFAFCATYNWHSPSESAFMKRDPQAIHEWVSIDHISRYPIAAVIAHEDPELGKRTGAFDISTFFSTAESYVGGQSDIVGGSTIPQQLVKNLYLSSTRTAWRKGLEAIISMPFSLVVSEKRELEMYLNYAQFGEHIYGICAASWYYFDTPPSQMTPDEAYQLAAILPMPSLARRADRGGIYVAAPADDAKFRRTVWQIIPADVDYLGGWKATVAQVGITDEASDHVKNTSDACLTNPIKTAGES